MRTRNHPRQTAATPSDTISWLYVLLTIICVAFLATGFFFAARQHFMAMDLGIKNSTLRKQVEDMEGEKRRLLLSREIVRSPGEIKRTAMKHGLRDAGDLFAPVEAATTQQPENRALVVKTAMTASAETNSTAKKEVKAFYPKEVGKNRITAKAPLKRISNDLVASVKDR